MDSLHESQERVDCLDFFSMENGEGKRKRGIIKWKIL